MCQGDGGPQQDRHAHIFFEQQQEQQQQVIGTLHFRLLLFFSRATTQDHGRNPSTIPIRPILVSHSFVFRKAFLSFNFLHKVVFLFLAISGYLRSGQQHGRLWVCCFAWVGETSASFLPFVHGAGILWPSTETALDGTPTGASSLPARPRRARRSHRTATASIEWHPDATEVQKSSISHPQQWSHLKYTDMDRNSRNGLD